MSSGVKIFVGEIPVIRKSMRMGRTDSSVTPFNVDHHDVNHHQLQSPPAMVDLWNAGDAFGVELEGNWLLGTGTDGIEQHSMLAVGPPDRPNPSKTSAAPSTETTTAALTLRAAGRHIPRFAQNVGFGSHVDTKAQEPFLVVGMAVFKTMEESRSNDSLGTSFGTDLHARRPMGQDSPDVEPSVLNTAMGVAESSSSFYSPSNKPSDVSYHVSTLSKFWISFLRRYELSTMRHLKKTHLDIGEYIVWWIEYRRLASS
ncbi:hypothetical protein ARMGADRAFT_1082472 [Armillaria gallica]|uniref:Uncharacterized protein n=1 Tax=Armillaria gallica TaxID=47427 RepID=A0A2H3D696_ARMGA|nr:hypothetical protein ARMGADRAFT_1082472 [Armillaria gallica]